MYNPYEPFPRLLANEMRRECLSLACSCHLHTAGPINQCKGRRQDMHMQNVIIAIDIDVNDISLNSNRDQSNIFKILNTYERRLSMLQRICEKSLHH